MKYVLLATAIFMFTFTSMKPGNNDIVPNEDDKNFPAILANDASSLVNNWVDSMYNAMNLKAIGLNYDVFYKACTGYEFLLSNNFIKKDNVLTICDLGQKSSKKRLYVLDMDQGKLLFNTYVAHGRNSGTDFATRFSNSPESFQSSLGFAITAETYQGDNGYSLRFDGMEKGFNDNIRSRAIVMHGSDYVNADRAKAGVMMGRSFGCPSVSIKEHKQIIDVIKGGSCFFTYHGTPQYAAASKIINAHFDWPILEQLKHDNTNSIEVQLAKNDRY